MRIGILSSMMALLAGMGTALAQSPPSPATAPVPAVRIPSAQPNPDQPLVQTAAQAPPQGPAPSTMPPVPAGDNTASIWFGLPPNPALTDPNAAPIAPPIVTDPSRFYAIGEYLLWKIKDAPVPLTQVSVPITASGIAQEQVSQITIGNGAGIDYGGRSGFRATAGLWCDVDHCLGFELSGFTFENRQAPFLDTQQANLPLTVTIIQVVSTSTFSGGVTSITSTDVPIAVQLPATLTVTASGHAGPTSFWGAEANARSTRCQIGGLSIDLLGGFRYLNFSEVFNFSESMALTIAQSNTIFSSGLIASNAAIPTIPPALGTLTTVFNTTSNNILSTHNNFYAAQVGTSWEWLMCPRLSFNGYTKIAVGAMDETANIISATTTTSSSGVTPTGGGVLPVNGLLTQSRTKYAVAPEINMKVAYEVCPHVRLAIGYNFLYLSSVARPGEQLQFGQTQAQVGLAAGATVGNATTTTTLFPQINNLAPQFNFKDTDFWAQGITANVEIRY